MRQKKGALNLSINAIVILILAITMLGLGLAFMRNIFGSATKEFEEVSLIVKKSFINSSLCKGCGTCAATCPNGAISIKQFDFDQITAMIESYLLEM